MSSNTLKEIMDMDNYNDTDSSVSGSCDDTDYNRRLIFDWTDDDLDDEYFYNYDND